MPALAELRLNDNRLLALPAAMPPGLRLLDVGNNLLADWAGLEWALRGAPRLANVTLRGNPIATAAASAAA